MWIPVNQGALRSYIKNSGDCQTDFIVAMYFISRFHYLSEKSLVFYTYTDIVKGTGALSRSVRLSVERLTHIGFLLAKLKSKGASVMVYALNPVVVSKE